ncbi:MAG: hypothetical protein FIB07_08255 [Candidatus Methanoperedens sp.]|nr:hypothetical protein [Candidatus Methanoperedens sp.]
MKIGRFIILLIFIPVVFSTAAYAAEANFTASLLTANDVNCKKCHTDTPHIIHANKPVECVNCHGDKLNVSVPQCTKCHNGPIHQVHAGKVATQTCAYCHKTITDVHNNLLKDAVCSHCHQDLIQVHGNNEACVKCHKSPPAIVKPLQSEGMTLICQNCHSASSVATIHGGVDEKKGCYGCHKGTSKASGSEIPHAIHASKVDCQNCHQENGQVVVPKCTRCHDIDTLHAFNKIGKLTSQSGLQCSACHTEETKLSAPQAVPSQPAITVTTVSAVETAKPGNTPDNTIPQASPVKSPGFTGILAIGLVIAGYIIRKRGLN